MNNAATVIKFPGEVQEQHRQAPNPDTELTRPFSVDITQLAFHIAGQMEMDVKLIHEVLVSTVNFLCTAGATEALERAKAEVASRRNRLADEDVPNVYMDDNPDLLQSPEEAYEDGYQIGYNVGYREAMEEMGVW